MIANDGPQAMGECPSSAELSDFNQGRLMDADLNRVAEHVEAPCPRCLAALEKLEGRANLLLADLRGSPPLSSVESEEACRWVLSHVPGRGASDASTVPIARRAGDSEVGAAPNLPAVPGYEVRKELGRSGMGI